MACSVALAACGSGGGSGDTARGEAPTRGTDEATVQLGAAGIDDSGTPEGEAPGPAATPPSRRFDDLVAAARSSYSGETVAAALDLVTVGRALETLLAGPASTTPVQYETEYLEAGIAHAGLDGLAGLASRFPLDSFSSGELGYAIAPDEPQYESGVSRDCSDGGVWTPYVQASDEDDVDGRAGASDAPAPARRTVVLDDCRFLGDSWSVTGRFEIEYAGEPSARRMHVGYDDVVLTGNGRTLGVTGVVVQDVADEAGECPDGSREATLLVRDLDGGEERLLDGLTRTIERATHYGSCSGAPVRGLEWAGRMYLSGAGRIDVATPTPLSLEWNDSFQDESAPDPEGRVTLVGGEGAVATLEVLPLEGVREPYAYLPRGYARLTVGGADGDAVTMAVEPAALHRGAFAQLGDADADGLPDGYERAYGLDPDDPADASVDDDGDGMTPLEEFAELGLPGDGYGPAEATRATIDLGVAVRLDEASGEQRVEARVGIDLEPTSLRLLQRTYRLELVGGEWLVDTLPEGCLPVAGADPSIGTVECTVDTLDRDRPYRLEIGAATGRSDADGTLDVRASMLSPDFAPTAPPRSAAVSAGVEYARRADPELELEVPAIAFGEADAPSRLQATLVQPALARAVDVRVDVSPSPGLEILSAELLSSGSQAPLLRCATGAQTRCTMPEVRAGDTLTLDLEYRVTGAGPHALEWRAIAPSDAGVVEATAFTEVRRTNSMAPLQALIDTAANGDTVTLPAGTYTGTLNGRGLEIDVRGADGGADGGARTVLVSVDRDAPILIGNGPRNTWTNIDWRTTGAPLARTSDSNLTISHSTIEPVAGLPHEVDGLVGDRSGPHRLHANRIADFGTGDEGRCASLFVSGTHGYSTGSTYVQNNLFLDNACDELLRFGSDYAYSSPHLTVTGNTFVGSPRIVAVTGVERGGEVLRFRNNVVVGAATVVDVPENRFATTEYGRPTATLVSSRNVVWNSDVQTALQADWLSRAGISVEGTDLAADPAFVDPSAGDYRLRADSALIDSGVEPDPYVWDYYDFRDEFLSPPADAVTRAIDGDGNGTAEHDIGAFEFVP